MNELAIISLLVSLLFVELTGIAPGGIIVPFYFVLYLDEPLKMAATVISAALSVHDHRAPGAGHPGQHHGAAGRGQDHPRPGGGDSDGAAAAGIADGMRAAL